MGGRSCVWTLATRVFSCESSVPGVLAAEGMFAQDVAAPEEARQDIGRGQRHRTDMVWRDCFEAKLPKEELSFRCALEILTLVMGSPGEKVLLPGSSLRVPRA